MREDRGVQTNLIRGCPHTQARVAPGRARRLLRRVLNWLPVPLLLGLGAGTASAHEFSSIVFYYGAAAPVASLERFDVAVVEPHPALNSAVHSAGRTRWLAYVSVGEVQTSRPYFSAIPPSWLAGRNTTWKSRIVDQSASGWPAFFVAHVAAPLWKMGYRGFFLDTLDSYQLLDKDPAAARRQQAGLVRVILALRRAYPHAMLILNRGFELLPQIHAEVDAVAFESLYQGWNEAKGEYVQVSPTDRDWLMGQANKAKSYGLPVVSIDYCAPSDAPCTVQTARLIRDNGYIPYVGDGHLQEVNLAVLPN